jgi:hypothetical protein
VYCTGHPGEGLTDDSNRQVPIQQSDNRSVNCFQTSGVRRDQRAGGNLRDTQGAIRASHEDAVPAILPATTCRIPPGVSQETPMPGQNDSSNPSAASPEADFIVEHYGSVFFVRCQDETAQKALAEFGEPNSPWFGDALAVEPRFIGGLVSSLRENGWSVR